MLKLLNRISWLIALSFGFIIAFVIIGTNSYKINGEDIFFSGVFGVIAGLVIKKLFLSQNFIQNRLEFFANSLKENYLNSKNVFEKNSIKNKEIFENIPEEIEVKEIKNEENSDKILEIQKIESKKSLNKTLEETKNFDIKNISEKQKEENFLQKNEKIEKNLFEIYFEKTGNYIKDFFSTNLLAKLGGILIFLAVVYFLKGVANQFWEVIGPKGRIAIGIVLGFIVYGTGIKIEKKFRNEGIILAGIGILINFAVILAGRYLVGGDGYLTETTTFLFLILNTLLGIVTSLVYKSKTLLIFSFIFAYLNPLIIGDKQTNDPYTLLGYSMIVSLGALFISQKQNSISLFIISFIAGNFLFLLAPTSDFSGEITKIIALNIYNSISIFYATKLKDKYKFFLEIVFSSSFFIISLFLLSINQKIIGENINFNLYLTSIFTSIFFLGFSYFLSFKKTYLYSIGTIGTILTLAPLIIYNNKLTQAPQEFIKKGLDGGIILIDLSKYIFISIFAIIIFAVAKLILPFINKKLIEKKSLSNFIFGSLAGAIFFAYQIYNFGEIHFPGVVEGFAFLGLAIVYFLESYFLINKLGIENVKKDESLKNIFYTFSGISISLFSIAIAFVFSNYPEIITTTWLFEASILYYFYYKTNSNKIFIASTIIFIIGLIKFGILVDVVHKGDFKFLISFIIIFASFIINLYFLNKSKTKDLENIHHIFHIIGMITMGMLLEKIIPSTGNGYSMLAISIFISILGFFYSKFRFNFLKTVFIIIIVLFSFVHLFEVNFIFHNLANHKKEYLKILQYLVSIIIFSNYFIWKKFGNSDKSYTKAILIISGIYLFLISNFYVIDIFSDIFGFYTLTIYWGLIASGLLFYGIQKDIIKYRTIGLYFLSLTTLKIFLYDVWQISDSNARIVVFIILGVIFITISTMYTKRFGNNMKGEFDYKNLKS